MFLFNCYSNPAKEKLGHIARTAIAQMDDLFGRITGGKSLSCVEPI
jgi:hypothetical protein